MSLRSIVSSRELAALAAVPVIALAAVGWHHLPTNVQVYAPLDVHGRPGTAVTGDTLAVTATDVGVASAVRVGYQAPLEPSGRWLVVQATVRALNETVLPKAELAVGANTYVPASEFVVARLGVHSVDPGISQRGSWIFDVPTDLIDRSVVPALALRVWTERGPFVSRVVIDIDGRRLTRSGLITVDEIELQA